MMFTSDIISDDEEEELNTEIIQASEKKSVPTRAETPEGNKTEQCSPIRASKTYPEVIQPIRSWVSPAEVSHPVRGWTSRAGSFVAEKMALFEKLSTGDGTTVRKASFLER